MGNRSKTIDRDTPYLFPPSVQEWLPEKHLARFVVEIVSKLDLRKLEDSYTKRGSEGYHPATMLALLFYGYATGVFSTRKLEQATYDSVAFVTLRATRIQTMTRWPIFAKGHTQRASLAPFLEEKIPPCLQQGAKIHGWKLKMQESSPTAC